jgi:hypothetical protein
LALPAHIGSIRSGIGRLLPVAITGLCSFLKFNDPDGELLLLFAPGEMSTYSSATKMLGDEMRCTGLLRCGYSDTTTAHIRGMWSLYQKSPAVSHYRALF